MATSVGTPKLRSISVSHHTFQSLYRNLPNRQSLSSPSSSLFYSSSLRTLTPTSPFLARSLRRRFSARADLADNGAEKRQYDFDLFTIGAGSGGVRASRFATSYGAYVAICELPFATISSDTAGGVGGTCVLRGCVPKKLLLYASKFSHKFDESHGFGWSYEAEPKNDWSTLIANKNAELQRCFTENSYLRRYSILCCLLPSILALSGQ